MRRIPVILDTDIGGDIDDTWALGLILKCPELELKMAVTEDGDPEYEAKILCKMLAMCGRSDVPVAQGVKAGEYGQPQAPWVADYALSDYPGPVRRDGVDALIECVRSSPEPVTIIAIGPVTTLSQAVDRAPDIAEKARLVGMHGCVRKLYPDLGGVIAEHNVNQDVPSWKNVFGRRWLSVTITPLDTCGDIVIEGSRWQTLLSCRESAELAAILENYRIWRASANEPMPPRSSILFDTVAVYLAFTHDNLVMEPLDLRVDEEGVMRETGEGEVYRVLAAMRWVDVEKYYDFLVARLTAPTAGGAQSA